MHPQERIEVTVSKSGKSVKTLYLIYISLWHMPMILKDRLKEYKDSTYRPSSYLEVSLHKDSSLSLLV